jgi:hypothetical protein
MIASRTSASRHAESRFGDFVPGLGRLATDHSADAITNVLSDAIGRE